MKRAKLRLLEVLGVENVEGECRLGEVIFAKNVSRVASHKFPPEFENFGPV
jgi:hypothetical protein